MLSTLHTNDAPGAVTRLIDMGCEPFLVSASLEGVLAQRLVRTICKDCKTPYEPNEAILTQLGVSAHEIGDKQFFTGAGCDACGQHRLPRPPAASTSCSTSPIRSAT